MQAALERLQQKLLELYWTVTRAMGLGYLHDGSSRMDSVVGRKSLELYWTVTRALGLGNSSRDHQKRSMELFQSEQLPRLLTAISDLNKRIFAAENLVRSAPVAFRNIHRTLEQHQAHLSKLSLDVEGFKLREMNGDIWSRIEFVRRELMFEIRYGSASAPLTSDNHVVEPKILDQESFAAAKTTEIRLNIGCGHITLQDYLNVDRRELPGVQIVAEVGKLPFELGEVTEIRSAHLLEHFPQEELKRKLLPYWKGLLKRDGVFRAVVPDAEAMAKGVADGTYPYEAFREVTFGAQDYNGDFHFNMFTPASLTKILEEQGFQHVEIMDRNRRNGDCFEFEIIARA